MTIVTRNVYGDGTGDYTTLNAALVAESNKNLPNADISVVYNCKGAIGTSGTSNITAANGWVTDATHTITISTTTANRHTGLRNTGAYLTGGYYIFSSDVPYLTIDGVGFGASSGGSALYINSNGGWVTIKNCCVWDIATGNAGIAVFATGATDVRNIINNLIYKCGYGINKRNSHIAYIYNNTIINCITYGIRMVDVGTSYLKNNAVFGSGTTDLYSGGSDTEYKTTNYTSDASGNTQVTIASCNFTSITSGSENGNITSGSSLLTNGTNLTTDTYYPFTSDYKATGRYNASSIWDIGASQITAYTITKTVITSGGGDYTSLNAALTAQQKNLLTEGTKYVFECSGTIDSTAVIISATWITDITHTITIQATGANRHTGVRGTGYRLITNGAYSYTFICNVYYVTVNGIAFSNSNASGYNVRFVGSGTTQKPIYFLNCLCHDFLSNSASIGAGLGLLTYVTAYVINCTFLNCYNAFYQNTYPYIYAYNVTVLHNRNYGINVSAYSYLYAKNCYSGGCTTADYYKDVNNLAYTLTSCYSADGTESTTVVSLANAGFTNSTAGSENINTLATSQLRKIGTDLSTDATYPFNYDYTNTTRPTGLLQWDIGAYQNFLDIPITFKPIIIIV